MAALFARGPWYELFAALGLIAALILARSRLQKAGVDGRTETRAILSAVAAFGAGVCVSNIANWFFFPDLLELPLLRRIGEAGLTFYPGMIAAVGLTALLWRLSGVPRETFGDCVAAFPLFHGIARIGCVLTGCCYGIPLGSGDLRFPSAAVEAAFCLLLALWLLRKRPARPCLCYFTLYPVYRFFAEFLRGDDRGRLFPLPLSVSQQISLIILISVALYLGARTFRHRRKETDL